MILIHFDRNSSQLNLLTTIGILFAIRIMLLGSLFDLAVITLKKNLSFFHFFLKLKALLLFFLKITVFVYQFSYDKN